MRAIEDARDVEVLERAKAQMPPSYNGRATQFHNIVSNQIATKKDADMLRWQDAAEDERHMRYKNRYIVDHNIHLQDVKGDLTNETRKLNRVAPERFHEQTLRGYDILTNQRADGGVGTKARYEPFCTQRQTPWDLATAGRSASMPPNQAVQASRHLAPTPEQPSPVTQMPVDGYSGTIGRRSPTASAAESESQRKPPRAPTPAANAAMGGADRVVRTGGQDVMSSSSRKPSRASSLASGTLRSPSPATGIASSIVRGASSPAPPPPPVKIPGSPGGSVYSKAM